MINKKFIAVENNKVVRMCVAPDIKAIKKFGNQRLIEVDMYTRWKKGDIYDPTLNSNKKISIFIHIIIYVLSSMLGSGLTYFLMR